ARYWYPIQVPVRGTVLLRCGYSTGIRYRSASGLDQHKLNGLCINLLN
ncbi:hypothetical protein A2U01_0019477, partial [Trifolium medium]|nr:hypothetical protein [Trifolium medium]